LSRASGQIAAAAVALALAQPGPAYANGDPASHVLPDEDVYLPRQSKPSGPVETALEVLLRRTTAAGYPLRVALIGSTADLGDVPELFGQPQEYAGYLAPEIAFGFKGALLIVMPAGYGTHNAGKGARAVAKLEPPSGSDGDALARGAIEAGAAMSRAAGHPVKVPKVAGGSGSSGGALVPLLVLGGMLALGAALAIWKRQTVERPGADVLDPPARE
jgi:hypothetical protein